jgi:glutamate synthase (NADPH/NADH) small chain
MAQGMLAFTGVEQRYPDKRAAALRISDFAEIAARMPVEAGRTQASRCSQCGVPFCQVHCPLHNHIPDWLKLAAEGRLEEAYRLSSLTSTMPEVCGRICPQDRLCEGNCVIEQSGHGAVTIGAVETFLAETAWAQGWVPPLARAVPPSGQSVAVIGSGPAGLTAAEHLHVAGHEVHVHERADRAGGLLTYGIPGFKLEKPVVVRRVERLAAGGIHFHLNSEIGRDITFPDLRARHDAVLVATGVYRARAIEVPGTGLAGIVKALDYLVAANRVGFGETVPAFAEGRLDAAGKRVVVVGGGDTAMDCVRTAVRQGAASVTCLYRRDRGNMPGSAREVGHAEEEGVAFRWLSQPTAFLGSGGRVTAVAGHAMRLAAADASGRRQAVADGEARFELPAELVIEALGFEPEDLPAAFAAPDLAVNRWGTLKADGARLMTSLPGVFAAGDIVRGASLVVWAMRDGRDVARAMAEWLAGEAAGRRLAAAA